MTTLDHKIFRGDSATLFVPLLAADGTALDLAVVKLKWRLAHTWHTPESEALVSKEIGSGITAAQGGINIALDPTETDLEPGLYYHELKLWDGVGAVATTMTGTIAIKHAIVMTVPTP